jgi:hypothetical protein
MQNRKTGVASAVRRRGNQSKRNLASVAPPGDAAADVSRLKSLDLSYEVLDVRTPESRAERHIEQAYRCWQQVWSETFRELDGVERVHSDEFTRQHEIGALFLNDVCIGLTGYRWVDLSLPLHQDDSYFKVWPKAPLRRLQRDGSNVCIGSHLTVLPAWRGRRGDISVKEILLALSVRRFQASSADVLAGTMRNDRAMNVLGFRLGFTALFQDAVLHGVGVDLVAFYRDIGARRTATPELDEIVDELWADAQHRSHHHEGRSRKIHRRA